jgi:hypothetical protein
MAKKLTMQQKSERGRSERRVVAQTARKVRDKKEDAAIAKANAMLDEMMRDGTIKDIQKAKQEIMRKTGDVMPNGQAAMIDNVCVIGQLANQQLARSVGKAVLSARMADRW